MSEPEKGGAAAFIASVDRAAGDREAFLNERVMSAEVAILNLIADAVGDLRFKRSVKEKCEESGRDFSRLTDAQIKDVAWGDTQGCLMVALAKIFTEIMPRDLRSIIEAGEICGGLFVNRAALFAGLVEEDK